MEVTEDFTQDDIIIYSVLYSSVTVVFAMAVLSKFLTNEFRFGFRSVLSLIVLFLGEPLCQFLVQGPSGLFVFAAGCLLVYSILPASHLPVGNKAVLITGCDSGFGHALVQKLDSIGMRVFAGCLHVDSPGAVELRNKCSSRLTTLQMDVTKPKEIEDAAVLISNQVLEEGLWGLVNNAGVWYCAELEMTSEKVARHVMDVNLFGAMRVTKSVLPLIRRTRGRIINVSSLMGRISLEGSGAYSMSKHALVAYSDTLRLEMKKWGVHVSIVEPMGYLTGNIQESVLRPRETEVWESLDEATQEAYGREYLAAMYSHVLATTHRYHSDLTPVIRCLRSGLLSMRPHERYPCGTGADTLMSLYGLLPVWLADRLSMAIGIVPRNVKPAQLT